MKASTDPMNSDMVCGRGEGSSWVRLKRADEEKLEEK